MKTKNRLTDAYESARVIDFDESSKFVFLSDAHRGDGSQADEFSKNSLVFTHALQHYLTEGHTLVEAGDMDDLWEFPHIRHIVKANPKVFGLLRAFHNQHRYVRLFGNHDAHLADPRFVRHNLSMAPNPVTGDLESLLPGLNVEPALVLRHRATGQEVIVVHGHQGDFSNDQNWRLTMWTFRWFWRSLHKFGIHSPSSPIRNSYKRHKVERNYVKWIRKMNIILICGHTHREKFPRGDETPYFNTGSCAYNGYITGLEIEADHIQLVRWRVETDANGYLHVVRTVLAGPTPLECYDRKRHGGLTPSEEQARLEAARAASRRVTARKAARYERRGGATRVNA